MTAIVYLHRAKYRLWCVLRTAHPGGRISTLCLDAVDYSAVCVSTVRPGDVCAACDRELKAGTTGAAVVVSRAKTIDLRGPSEVAIEDLVSGEWRMR